MEGDRVRALTTRAVALCLGAGATCLALGMGALLLRGRELGTGAVRVTPPAEMPAALARGDGLAWLSLGVLFLIGCPILRALGLTGWCWVEGRRRAAAAGLGVLGFLISALVRATLAAGGGA